MRFLVLACLAAACGPSLQRLVADHHDREAVCGAADGRASDRARVGAALDRDASSLVHVTVIEPARIARILAKESVGPEMRFARIELQTNRLPVDHISARLTLAAGPRVLAAPIDWDVLARLTGERLPPKHVSSTYLTGGNMLRGAAALLTLGTSLIFTEFRSRSIEIDAPDSEYAATAPRAHALFHALDSPGCSEHESGDSAGLRCTWFVLLLPPQQPVADARLEVTMRYTAQRLDRRGQVSSDACTIESRSTIPLGSVTTLDATLANMFGAEMRRLGDLAR
jgi:hypothetical protein